MLLMKRKEVQIKIDSFTKVQMSLEEKLGQQMQGYMNQRNDKEGMMF